MYLDNEFDGNEISLPEIKVWVFDHDKEDVKCLACNLYGNVAIGASEQCYDLGQNQTVYLCAYYNKRVQGTYQFVPEYFFYIAEQSIYKELYWNQGTISNQAVIAKEYVGLEAARNSYFYECFVSLKNKIESQLRWSSEHALDPYEPGGSMIKYKPDASQELFYTLCEIPIKDRLEFVQFYFRGTQLITMSVSKEPLLDLMMFIKDFEEVDANELHLRTFLPIDGYALEPDAIYHAAYADAQDSIDYQQGLWD